MKKRSIALILAASLAALTGCGGAGSTAATTAASTTAAQSAGADEAAANVKATPIEGAPEQTDIDAAKGDNYGFPKGTITWVVPGKAGGGSDLAIRYLATTMQQDLGLTTTVTNYDSNTVGHQTVANAANDGSSIMLATAALNIQWITGNADVNPKEDLTLIAALDDNGFSALCAPASAPYNTFDEMIQYAKDNPGHRYDGLLPRHSCFGYYCNHRCTDHRKYCFDAWTVGVFLTLLLCDHTGCCTFQGLHLEGHHGSRHRSSAWFCRSRSDHGCCTLYLR